ncbi:unnamed protein product, partial [Sphacelaria rigidula]
GDDAAWTQAAGVEEKVDTDCVVFAVRKDNPKYKRVKEMMEVNKHVDKSTRMRFSEAGVAVFHPSLPPLPRRMAVASIPLLAPPEAVV